MRNLKKPLMLLAATATLIAVMSPAGAATTSSNFDVTVNLTATCEITAGPSDVAFSYTSFQTIDSNSTGGDFSVRCTNTLPYTMALDATTGTVLGLNYSLSLSAAGGTGAGLTEADYTVDGLMAADQSGTCATSPDVGTCSGSQTHTVTITY
jgi:spore coat protein U-like protein